VVANEAFFQRKQAAAVLKHGILSRYPRVFATMAGKRTGRVVYFDGYAGPGRYEDGSPGSPLLAVETARATAQWDRDVECLFAEKDPAFAADLRRTLDAEAPPGMKYTVWRGDVAEYVDQAVAIAGDDPMLSFLDPFGTALNYTSLTGKLLGRTADKPTEVLLNLNLESVWRIGGLLTGDEKEADSSATLARLDGFFGDTWWRDEFRRARATGDEASASAAAIVVAQEFQRRVRAATGFDSFGVPVRRRPGHRPLFLLLLFSRWPMAAWKFNEQVSLANAEWRRACWQEDLDGLLTDLAADPEDLFGGSYTSDLAREVKESEWETGQAALEARWVEGIAENLRTLLRAHTRVRLGDHLQEVYGETLGSARDMHVNTAWKRLVASGEAAPKERNASRLEHAWLSRPTVK